MFYSITNMVDELVSMFESIDDFADTANFRFVVALKDELIRRYIVSEECATLIVAQMDVSLPLDMHNTHADDFDRLVDAFATVIFKLEDAISREFGDAAEEVLLTFAKSFHVRIDA